ncbi:MAG TPA: PAS domain S-box protein [Gemmatimonadaceae bacterium]|nr:PAS domain S-box protein [Gemmatimonadaceae bacterium]
MPTRKILIVNDEPAAARELVARLTVLGYDVAGICASGREVIDTVEHIESDVMLMSMALQGDMSGPDAAEEIRRRRPIPIIFTTADTDEASLRGAGITEPFGYVAKPFTDRELWMTIELALAKDDATRQIREMEERFFDVSIDMLCFLDFNGYFKRLNPAWERTLGFTRKELMSQPFIEFVHPDDRERTLAQNADVRSGGQALGFENRYRCKDGSYKWFLWNATPGISERTIYSVARDITARKLAEQERERLVRELQAALAEVRSLQEILPICSYCKKVRDDENYWHSVESYISQHTNTRFSHSICPSCFAKEVEPRYLKGDDE